MINIFSIQVALVLSTLSCTLYYVIPTTGNQGCPTDQDMSVILSFLLYPQIHLTISSF